MGFKAAFLLLGGGFAVQFIHSLVNTADDWKILFIVLMLIGLRIKDEHVDEYISLAKWVRRVRNVPRGDR